VIKVRNPRSGKLDYEFAPAAKKEVKKRIKEIRLAQPEWSAKGIQFRVGILLQWKDAILESQSEILERLSIDTGRRRLSEIELSVLCAGINRWSRKAPSLMGECEGRSETNSSISFNSQLVPYQVIGAISPWNFPMLLSMIDAIPALLAGCGVLIKPSEITPRFIAPLQKSIETVPELAAVLHCLPGAAETGTALIEEVDAICFTGSLRTGRAVALAAARKFIPAFLELGGKDPCVVTATADLDLAAQAILRASIANTGQACQSIERIYVQESIFETFVSRLLNLAQSVRINYPKPDSGELGPLISTAQIQAILLQLEDAVEKGARILTGGQILMPEGPEGGKWMLPTVLIDVDHKMRVMREETLGPVLPLMSFQHISQAIELANDSEYGLSAAVFAGSIEEAEQIARQLRAGAVSINDAGLTSVVYDVEKNSFGHSGLGLSRMGDAGFLRYFRKKSLLIQHGQPAPIEYFDEGRSTFRPM
jgi:acyl-CoA reductase-like NAD-dependent aldehyde dehydrogenase